MGDEHPARCRIRMYQVGFGDCFLLTFEYDQPLNDGRDKRHVLIDFGSTRLPTGWKSLSNAAKQIADHTDGQIDVVVVSHRHKDHLSAFGEAELVETFVAAGYPKLVVRSWSERPELADDATGDDEAIGPKSQALLGQLRTAEAFAAALGHKLTGAAPRSLAGEALQLAADQVANGAAVERLDTWAGSSGRYLRYGLPSGIEALVPGIEVDVLGPPTVDQHKQVASQRSRDPNEFWMIYQGLVAGLESAHLMDEPGSEGDDAVPDPAASYSSTAASGQGSGLSAAAEAPGAQAPIGDIGPVRWLTDRMVRQNLNALLRVTNVLDTALNNTSLILLFRVPSAVGPLRLLFPGDAQIENWEYALKFAPEKEANLAELRDIDLYKVGHHGSRNATPRTLYDLWTAADGADRPLVAMMSTKSGVHGRSPATRVPRETLVAALDTRTAEHLYSTEGITSRIPYVELVADLTAGRAFEAVTIGTRRSESAMPGAAASPVDPTLPDDS